MSASAVFGALSAFAAIAAAIVAYLAYKRTSALTQDSQMPLLAFTRTCTQNPLNGMILNAHNNGLGPALALDYVWRFQPVAQSVRIEKIPADEPGILVSGGVQSIRMNANWLRMMYDEGNDPRRLIGTMTATYRDVHNRKFETYAEVRFTNDLSEIGMCDHTAIMDERITLPGGVVITNAPPPADAQIVTTKNVDDEESDE